MELTEHARERIYGRLAKAGLTPEGILPHILEQVKGAREYDSFAVKLAKLDQQVGEPWDINSNGDEVWAIVREGKLVTLMLRRSSQPIHPKQLRVEKVFTKMAMVK